MKVGSNGQLNLVTGKLNQKLDELDFKHKRNSNTGRTVMFTPLIAHRYLQRQINEICLEFKKERNLNSQFRDEIGTVQTFKFFTQNALMDLEATLK